VMDNHYENIICPACGCLEIAKVEHTVPLWSYSHLCGNCGHLIKKADWKEQGLLFHSAMEDVMYKFKPNSIDLVCTDPPFGVRKDEAWDAKELFVNQIGHWLNMCLSVARHAVIWFCASKMMPYIFRAIKPELFHRQLDWKKPKGTQFAGASHNNIWYAKEPILIFSKDIKKTTSYGKDMKYNYDYLEYDTVPKVKFEHKTTKPVPLMAKLIQHYSSPGELVLDPFGGSGSTAEACIKTQRRYIYIEKSPVPDKPVTDVDGDNPNHYFNALKRLETINNQEDLFGGM